MSKELVYVNEGVVVAQAVVIGNRPFYTKGLELPFTEPRQTRTILAQNTATRRFGFLKTGNVDTSHLPLITQNEATQAIDDGDVSIRHQHSRARYGSSRVIRKTLIRGGQVPGFRIPKTAEPKSNPDVLIPKTGGFSSPSERDKVAKIRRERLGKKKEKRQHVSAHLNW